MGKIVTEAQLLAHLKALRAGRHLVALAGAPASGKSTLARVLADGLCADCPGRAGILSMDGYHFDNGILESRGILDRKGAPHTFDVGGLHCMLQRIRARNEAEVTIPVFDRNIEIARAGAAILPQTVEIILVEGNYLLLDQPPWNSLRGLFDVTVFLDVPEKALHERLVARWVSYKLAPAQITAKLEINDLPNGRIVRERSVPADLVVKWRDCDISPPAS